MDKTHDSIVREDILVCQPKNGFRFSADALLLAEFVRGGTKKKLIEIGAGSGVISALLVKEYGYRDITAVEIQQEMYDCLIETVKNCKIDEFVKTVHKDVREYKPGVLFEIAVCNPPYRTKGSGRVSKEKTSETARFNDTLKLDELFKFCKSYLKSDGNVFISYDADLLTELIETALKYKFEPKRLQMVQPAIDKRPKIILAEFKNNGGRELIIEPVKIQER